MMIIKKEKEFLEELIKELSDNKNKGVSIICASGARSKIVADFLIKRKAIKIFFIFQMEYWQKEMMDGYFQGYPITNYLENKEKMKFSGNYYFQEKNTIYLWNNLNDPEILKKSIHGCEEFVEKAKDKFILKIKVKIGPIDALFSGELEIKEYTTSF